MSTSRDDFTSKNKIALSVSSACHSLQWSVETSGGWSDPQWRRSQREQWRKRNYTLKRTNDKKRKTNENKESTARTNKLRTKHTRAILTDVRINLPVYCHSVSDYTFILLISPPPPPSPAQYIRQSTFHFLSLSWSFCLYVSVSLSPHSSMDSCMAKASWAWR